jgi:hypothetical protein
MNRKAVEYWGGKPAQTDLAFVGYSEDSVESDR